MTLPDRMAFASRTVVETGMMTTEATHSRAHGAGVVDAIGTNSIKSHKNATSVWESPVSSNSST